MGMGTFEKDGLTPEAAKAIEEKFTQRVEKCRAVWEATHDPLSIAEAHTLHALYRVPPPDWLDEAVVEICLGKRTDSVRRRHHAAMLHMERFGVIKMFREQALTWEDAYAYASEYLKNTAAAGDPETMRKSYKKVAKDLRKRRFDGKYHIFNDKRYRRFA